jgi:sulfopyruvate decarboxylase TPP-binding subunit
MIDTLIFIYHLFYRYLFIMKKLTLIEQIERIHTITYGKPIQHKLSLNEDFKTQYQKYTQQGINPEIVKQYLDDFNEIRNKKYREAKDAQLPGLNVPTGEPRFNVDNYKTFKELEILVDYVAGQRKFGSQNFEDIKVDGKPIFENEDVEIYYADTPRACVEYKGNKPYSWCVARSDSGNMFYNYRLNRHEPAFYFVKRKRATEKEFSIWNMGKIAFSGTFKDKYHFFVIQVIKGSNISDENNQNYIVTSAMNDGDKRMSWKEILEISPELNGLQQIFEPKPLTPEERKKIELYKNGLSDEEFAKLPYKEKEFYMAVYVKMNKPLTYEQFKILPEDLKNKYIGFGVGLSDKQFEIIRDNRNLIKRYIEITNRKFDEFIKSNNGGSFHFTDSEIRLIERNKFDNLDSDGIHYLLQSSIEPEKIINLLLSNENFINNLDSDGIRRLLQSSREPEKIMELLGQKGIDYINNLDSDGIRRSLQFSKERDKIINILLSNQNFINNLDSRGIYYLLQSSIEPEKVINIIGQKGIDYINNLDSDEIYNLHQYSKEPEKVINILLSNQNFINNLNSNEIYNLLQYSKEPEKVINFLLSNQNFINNLDSDGIRRLLQSSIEPEKVINIIGQKGINYINNLDSDGIRRLLQSSIEPKKVINIIGQKGINYINNLDSDGIRRLLQFSKKPDKVKNILKQYGLTKYF